MNIHPALSAFPAVTATLLVVVELLSQRRPSERLRGASDVLLISFLLVVPLTYLSGFIGAEYALSTEATHAVQTTTIESHRLAAQLAIFLLVPLAVVAVLARLEQISQAAEPLQNGSPRSSIWRTIYLLTLIGVWLLILYVSNLGGSLVFHHGAGVYLETEGIR